MKKFLLHCFLICLLINCSSRDEDVVEEVPVLPIKTVEKASFPDYDLVKLFQYEKNKLKSVFWTGGIRFDYFYSGNLITKVNCILQNEELFYSTKIEYYNDRIKKIIHRNSSEDRDLIFTYNWISDNQVRIQNNRYLQDNVHDRYIDVFLSNGNVVRNILHIKKADQIIESVIEYKYDSKNYPFKNIEGYSKIITSDLEPMPLEIFPRINNIITKKTSDKLIENGQTYNYPQISEDLSNYYNYKDNDYPTSYVDKYYTKIQIEYNK